MKSQSSTSRKAPPNEPDHALDLSEAGDLLRSATFVTLGVIASSLVIGAGRGAWRGELDSLRDSLAIAGFLLLICWMVILFAVTLISMPEVALWSYRRVAHWASRKPTVGGGVGDEWLDWPA